MSKTYSRIFLSFLTAFLGLSVISSPGWSQRVIDSVEVLVNDEPITTIDIEQRLRLVIAISGGVSSEEEFVSVREQVVQAMVDERLQLQEAKEFELEIPEAQLDQFFAQRAQTTGQSPEQFEAALTSIRSSKATMVKQIEAEFAWSELVQGRLGPQVNVADDEVNGYIDRIKSNRGKTEYRLGEIVLLINDQSQAQTVMASAKELVARLREGAIFAEIAKQLSASPSAALGGDLGWITEDTLFDSQRAAVEALEIGDISDPLRTPGGVQIYSVSDKRRVLIADPMDNVLGLAQVWLPFADAQVPEKRAQFVSTIEALRTEETSCEGLPSYVERAGASMPYEIGAVRIRSIRGIAREMLSNLDLGVPSDLLEEDDGLRVFFVCEKQEARVAEPEFDQVLNQLEQQRLAMMGRRYLRDLRRKAIVDYR